MNLIGNLNGLRLGGLAMVAMLAGLSTTADAASERNRYTHSACQVASPKCGVIVYGNAGGYVVQNVSLAAKGSQPTVKVTTPTGDKVSLIHPSCSDVSTHFGDSLNLAQYDTFIVPADCAYKLKINIAAGNKKSRDLFLTPGCQIETKTDGTTLQNEWHVKVKWTDAAKNNADVDTSGKPADAAGKKCGKLSKM